MGVIAVDFNLLNQFKGLFNQFEKKFNLLEEYFFLIQLQVDSWLSWKEDEVKMDILQKGEELNKRKNICLKQIKKEYPKATQLQLDQLATSIAKAEILIQEVNDFKNAGKIFPKTVKEFKKEFKTEKKFYVRYTNQSIIALAFSLIEGLLKELVNVLEENFGSYRISKKENGKLIPELDFLRKKLNYYGFLTDLDHKTIIKINGIRENRNHFIHSLSGNLTDGVIAEALKKSIQAKIQAKDNYGQNYQSGLDSIETIKDFYEKLKRSFSDKYFKSSIPIFSQTFL